MDGSKLRSGFRPRRISLGLTIPAIGSMRTSAQGGQAPRVGHQFDSDGRLNEYIFLKNKIWKNLINNSIVTI